MTQKTERLKLNGSGLRAHHKNVQNFSCKITESFLKFSSFYEVLKSLNFRWNMGATRFLISSSKLKNGYQIGQKFSTFLSLQTYLPKTISNVSQNFNEFQSGDGISSSTGRWNQDFLNIFCPKVRKSSLRFFGLVFWCSGSGKEVLHFCSISNPIFYNVFRTLPSYREITLKSKLGLAGSLNFAVDWKKFQIRQIFLDFMLRHIC